MANPRTHLIFHSGKRAGGFRQINFGWVGQVDNGKGESVSERRMFAAQAFVIIFCFQRKPGSIRANMTVGGLKPQG